MSHPLNSRATKVIRFGITCLVSTWLGLWSSLSLAEVVSVEDGSGAGFLLRQGGNCYVLLPTHLHGARLEGIRLGSDRGGGPIGTARIVHVVPDDADISIGLVRGGLSADCGDTWTALTRLRLDGAFVPGTEVMLQRPRQSVFEGRRLQVHSSGREVITLVPAPGERADLFGGTSGAVVFRGAVPMAMVRRAATAEQAFALRMDALADMVAAFFEEGLASLPASASRDRATSPGGDAVEAVSWSAHPVEGADDPAGLLEGAGPWIFVLEDRPVELVLRLTETDRLSRVTIGSHAGTEHGVPRQIGIVTDSSRDPNRPRPSAVPAPEMTPDGMMDLRIGERFAHTVTITVHSAWGDAGTVRIDSLVID